MNIPETIKIGGQIYKINMVDKCTSDNRNTDGMIHYCKNMIELTKEMEGDYKDYVFIHEIVHGIFEHCALEQNEDTVDRISRALFMVIKDNPEIFVEGGMINGNGQEVQG